MRWFSQWPEQQAQITRSILLVCWALLILSLFTPWITLAIGDISSCEGVIDNCTLHQQPGNQLFWGLIVPSVLLLLVAASHEFWRRICPLAFASQLPRNLGWQRVVVNKKGRLEPVKIMADSWLAKHHVELQWSLLIFGLA